MREIVDLAVGNDEKNREVILKIPGERVNIVVVYIGRGAGKINLNYKVKLLAPETTAKIRVVGLLMDQAKKKLKMELEFSKKAINAEGEELEDSLNLADEVKNESSPIIRSENGEAKGKHGVKVGQIDESQVEYLKSRGVSREKAIKILVKAKLMQALSWVEDEEKRAALKRKLEALDFQIR